MAERIDWEERFDRVRLLNLARMHSAEHVRGGRYPRSMGGRWAMFCAGLVMRAFEDYVGAAERVVARHMASR